MTILIDVVDAILAVQQPRGAVAWRAEIASYAH